MDKYISFLFLFINVGSIVTAVPLLKGYYWRDFDGVTPADALKAGYDETGEPLYIGQVVIDDKVIPGKIYENNTNIYYEWEEKAWSTNKNIMILCTEHPENFEWIRTTHKEVSKLTGNFLVEGGYQSEFLTYIGRVLKNGKLNLGKVICSKTNDCLAMYANDNGDPVEYHRFEILSYINSAQKDEKYYMYRT